MFEHEKSLINESIDDKLHKMKPPFFGSDWLGNPSRFLVFRVSYHEKNKEPLYDHFLYVYLFFLSIHFYSGTRGVIKLKLI